MATCMAFLVYRMRNEKGCAYTCRPEPGVTIDIVMVLELFCSGEHGLQKRLLLRVCVACCHMERPILCVLLSVYYTSIH